MVGLTDRAAKRSMVIWPRNGERKLVFAGVPFEAEEAIADITLPSTIFDSAVNLEESTLLLYKGMTQILCFGDSITQGYSDELGGWTQRMRRYLDSKYTYIYGSDYIPMIDVFNLGISGDTSNGLLKRIQGEATPRLLDDGTIVVIAIGTNDSIFRPNDTEEISLDLFHQNLNRLVQICREFTDSIVFIGTLACDENRMQPMPWSSTGKSYSNERLRNFNEVIVSTANASKLPVVDIFAQTLKMQPDEFLADGIHPNSEGHTLIAYETQHIIEKIIRSKL